MGIDTTARDLRAHRMAHNLTQAELAAELGVSQEMVAEIESGKRRPGPMLARRIAHILAGTADGAAERGPYRDGGK